MENFKSFGRKISVPFLQGYTSITGPNGSGKSNIADAILFVLGPKSAKAIRAGKLTDLIWNGGKDKNAADSCQVSLIFDNSDRQIPLRSEEHTSELQSHLNLVCRLLLEKKNNHAHEGRITDKAKPRNTQTA